jgi:fibro-slime domain-containing protein
MRVYRWLLGFGLGCVMAAGGAACSGSGTVNRTGTGGGSNGGGSGTGGGTATGGDASVIILEDSGTGGGTTVACDAEAGCVYALPDAGPYCGDGVVNATDEACDDGNALPGDGCTGVCQAEPNWSCPATGGACTSTIRCGDGVRTPGEACDDRNTVGGDGCAADCFSVEAGFYCPTAGSACLPLANCPDGRLQLGEECDDNNTTTGDGCSADCSVESGWRCTVANGCERLPVCGNRTVEAAAFEECDDGNTAAGDGCSATCRLEASYWSCPATGGACTKTVRCGDGKVEDTEQCDDGNATNFDGCQATCFLQSGYRCPVPGQKCVPNCGDGQRLSVEGCDDANSVGGDGCTSTCQVEPGWVCATVGASCTRTVCGDGRLEGRELCDAGTLNGLFTGDPNNPGCTLTCTTEPRCRDANGTTHACATTCGDGMKLSTEGCDDGNLINGDGCSGTCTVEAGFTCNTITSSDTKTCTSGTGQCLFLPITYRDFHGMEVKDGTASPDFFYLDSGRANVNTLEGAVQMPSCVQNALCTGLVRTTLDAQGKPVLASSGTTCQTCSDAGTPTPYMIYSAASFDYWFRARTGANQTTNGTIELSPIAGGQFRYQALSTGTGGFFPLDARIWGGEPLICQVWPYNTSPTCATRHNYHFTSEVRYLFVYRGGETLAFSGDDDVWVFVNGRLAVDLGGTHQISNGSIAINTGNQATYGMAPNNIYEIVVFHAERHPIDSNYQLTLTGFQTDRSSCAPTCGDGVATVFEECDNGTANSNTLYGGCTTSCKFGPRCGDGVRNGTEACDDGRNTTTAYGATGCAPGCVLPPRCGDGVRAIGEECDNGTANTNTGYGATGPTSCTTSCTLGPYCGDGLTQTPNGEACDDGLNTGGYGQCDIGCELGPRCGDNVVQDTYGEICDEGPTGGTNCTPTCGAPGFCGDAIVTAPEQCDNGVNDNSYGGCAVDCLYGPRCGDGVLQASFGEECDLGTSNRDGLYGGCSQTCKYGPHCGDGVVQSPREECDDNNTTNLDGCTSCITDIIVPK